VSPQAALTGETALSRAPTCAETTNGSPLEPLELSAQSRDLLRRLIAAALGLRAEPGRLRATPFRFLSPRQRVVGHGMNESDEFLALEQRRRPRIESESVLFDLGVEAEHTRLVQALIRKIAV